jgi:queuine tRNA-ribosyltransferase
MRFGISVLPVLVLAITQHNIVFQARLMGLARDAIMEDRYPAYVRSFFECYFGDVGYPRWCVDALRSVGIDILEGEDGAKRKVIEGNGAKWE